MPQDEPAFLRRSLGEIVGRPLTSVVFIHDYIQFIFHGPCLTTLTLPSAQSAEVRLEPRQRGYYDALCSQISIPVEAVHVTQEEVKIVFATQVALIVSLRAEDYTGPEAINYNGEDGSWIVA